MAGSPDPATPPAGRDPVVGTRSGVGGHAFRFGLLHMSPVHDGGTWLRWVREVEAMGYSTLLLSDHFGRSPVAPVPAMTAAAVATTRLRVGTLVLSNDFRQPAVLAKELATIDLLSGGRLEVGLGAGWMTADYVESGIVLDPPGRRIERMTETLRILRASLSGERADAMGPHYPLSGLNPVPAAVQHPGVPLLVGGGGRRLLGVAARLADIVSVNWNLHGGRFDSSAVRTGDASHTDQQVQWVAEAAGPRVAALELHLQVYLAVITDQPREAVAEWQRRLGLEVDIDELSASPHVLVGSVGQVIERLAELRERWGFSYFSFYDEAGPTMEPVVRALTGS